MDNQGNDRKNASNTNHTENGAPTGGLDGVIDFCRNHIGIIVGTGLILIVVIMLVAVLGGDSKKEDSNAETETVLNETETEEEVYAKDAYPEINQLFNAYYAAYAKGDVDMLTALADPISEAEKSYISVFSQYVSKYKNISCYTKKGLDDKSFIVSVYLEIKFKKIKTTVPGLERFYVRKRDDGTCYIDNLYGWFNVKMEEFEMDPQVSALLEEFSQQEDVAALQTDVWQKYETTLASDEALKTMVETTVPAAITVWGSDQVAAAKKAEEEQAAAEEAAKKAAEEEAAKKAEEEKKAAELASAVTVYATDKVNVRADASETADVLGQLEAGASTTRLEEKDGWSRIDYNGGTEGYVKSEYLSAEAPAAQTPAEEAPAENETPASSSGGLGEGTVITIQESVNLRKSMGEDAEKLATIFAGEKVTVIMSYAEGWTKVTYGDKTGFIKTDLLQ